MPEGPQGKDKFEHDKNRPRHHFKPICSEEELGDMHFSTENYSVALEYFEKALQKIHTISVTPADLVRLYRKISDCYRKKGLLREAMTFLQSARSHCSEDDEFGLAAIACRRGIILYDSGEIEPALRQACKAYRVFRTSDEHREVAHTQLLIANCYARIGRNDEAEQYFLDALSSYRRIDDTVGEAYVLNNLGLFHKNACRWGRAIHFLNRSLEICDNLGLTQHRVRVTLNLGIVHLKKRDFASAESSFTLARKMAQRVGDDLKYTRSTLMLGVTETHIGNLPSAEKHLLEARVTAERRGYGREIALSDEFLGDLMVGRGDLTGAMENYMVALSSAKKVAPEGDVVAEVLCRMAHVNLLQRKFDDAVSIGRRGLEIAVKCGELHEVGFIKRTIGLAMVQLKDNREGLKSIKSSVRTFLSVNNPYEATRTKYMLGEYLLKLGDRESRLRARKLINETLSFFENNEEYRDLAESHLLLARVERELGSRDESLMHIYEGQRLAEDLKDRNLVRRLRRMRKRIEEDAVGSRRARTERLKMPPELSGMFSSDPHLQSYLDYILGDLMRRLTAGHGFVTICSGTSGSRNIHVLARHGISEEATQALAEWFVSRENTDLTESVLITDTPHDSRTGRIREMLPNDTGPVYFHPLSKGREPFGLLFFQSNGNGEEAPRIGSNYDIVSTYAGFIGFLIRGILGGLEEDVQESGGISEGFRSIITSNEKMLKVLNLTERVAGSDSTVLLMGETGTGKGLIAEAIHRLSQRKDRKFIHVNCAALPETILESELFGHVKGSFTGAITDKKGLLTEADGGTIFLDEIGKTSLPLQGKLLQFLDTKKVRPVGSNEMFEVDVRLIFASKVDLLSLCRDGRMLEDFYYRINDFPLSIPPLRERKNDITLLADHYLKIFSEEMEKRIVGFSDEALCRLSAFEWRGNVRELEKVVKRAVILSEDNSMITPVELTLDAEEAAPAANLNDRIKDLEKAMISDSLCRNSWNRRATAGELGISYPTLLKKIKDFGLN